MDCILFKGGEDLKRADLKRSKEKVRWWCQVIQRHHSTEAVKTGAERPEELYR